VLVPLPTVDTGGGTTTTGGQLFPLVVNEYNSWSGTPAGVPPATLYLDFTGDVTDSWGYGYHPGTTPAYDIDGDPTTFSQEELDNIHEIWQRVAEAYSPFNVNVTTKDPGTLLKSKSARIIVGGDGDNGLGYYWPGARAGGIAYIGGFANDKPSTAYVFPGNLHNGLPKYSAMAAAHEAGHLFGLDHQRSFDELGNKISEYNHGTDDRAPFMGFSYFSTRGVWFYGTSGGIDNFQNDADVISEPFANQFGYRPDDHGNSLASATPLTMVDLQATVSGVIEMTGDQDFFKFSIDEESIALFQLTGAAYGAMLDPSMSLYDMSDGSLLATSATPNSDEALLRGLEPGEYAIAVSGATDANDLGLGQYTLTAQLIPGVPEPTCAVLVLIGPLLAGRRRKRR
jgi:hypothetical protein